MDMWDKAGATVCSLCGGAFTLPEDEPEGNLPRVLLCGHIYCTTCLLSIQCDSVIICPECEVESTLPDGGVYCLHEDSRIIGLIYTSKMNKKKSSHDGPSKKHRRNKFSPSTDHNANTVSMEEQADIDKIETTVDEALVKAEKQLAQLEHIHKTLTTGLEEQVKRERAQMLMEIKQAEDKALHAIRKWRDLQLSQLTDLMVQFSTSHVDVCSVQERIKALEVAMQMAREVRRVPFLEQYCTLDKVLETLRAPVDNQSFDLKCATMTSGISCVFQSESLNQSLAMSLKMEVSIPKLLPESQPKGFQTNSSNTKSRFHLAEGKKRKNCTSPSQRKVPSPQKKDQKSLAANSHSSGGSSPSPRPRRRSNLSRNSSGSDIGSPDLILEELLNEEQEHALLPTCSELVNDSWRLPRGKKNQSFEDERNVNQWVVVSHVVNPSHFYVRYLAEKNEREILCKKINHFCHGNGCHFASSDTVETGSMVFVNWKSGLWWRARVVEVLQSGCVETVTTCNVTQLAGVQVFILDNGLTIGITIQSEAGTTDSSLEAVNKQLRKVVEAVNVELSQFAPQAIRCSLKDLVPYELTKGWSEEAQVEFRNVVGSAAVEMRPLGQDKDSLLVDLGKMPMNQSIDVPISIREYLVFIEVARFYSPVTLSTSPLLYYPPVYSKLNTELDAVVSHVNNPADFFIQLVDNMESLLLSCKLQDCYNASSLVGQEDLDIYCPAIGQACVARYDDQRWYRAQVIGLPASRKVEVRFVDFGNIKILSVSDLRKIKDEFFALPSMAIHCCLSGVIPLDGETWTDTCTDRFINMSHQKLVTIVSTGGVSKTVPLPVKLFKGSLNDRTNIGELLVEEGLASFKDSLKSWPASSLCDDSAIWDPPLELGSSMQDIDPLDQKILREQDEVLDLKAQLKFPAQLKDMKVKVSHVNSPSSFYVQLTQYDSQLKRICEQVKQVCARTEPQDVVWKAETYCAAHANGVWERGQICSDVTSSNIAEVMRCDHGNVVKLHISNLRPLPSSLMGSLALECTLTGIRPAGGGSTWTATARDLISYYLSGVSAVITVKELTGERPVPVTLFCSNKKGQFVSIADFLASEGLALRERKPRDAVCLKPKETGAVRNTQTQSFDGQNKSSTEPASQSPLIPASIPPKPTPRSIVTAEMVRTKLYDPPELPCLGRIQVTVSAIGEDGLIYTRSQDAECQLEQLRERIQQSMKTLPHQKPYTWKSVLGCAVIGPDMLWYRGQLLEVLGGHVKVQYVDYGLVESIPVVHVYPMLLCEDFPHLCMPCQLHAVNPIGGMWQREALALLKEMLLNRCVDMHVVELPSDPRKPLTVELFVDELSLSRILCQHEHASIDRTVLAQKGHSVLPPSPVLDDWDIGTEDLRGPEEPVLGRFVCPNLPQKGEHFQVRVKHLWTPNELFLLPLEGTADLRLDGETLDEALGRINANITRLPRLANFPHGGACLAEYSDGNYYRAKLMEITSTEPVTTLVQHVDFGSYDTLPTSRLRQMPPELLRFPLQAIKAKVSGIKAPTVNTQEDVLPYSPEWSVKAVLHMIDLLHCDITASIVAHEPELTVLLYNKDMELVHLPLVNRGLAELE